MGTSVSDVTAISDVVSTSDMAAISDVIATSNVTGDGRSEDGFKEQVAGCDDWCIVSSGNTYGTYIHGIFDSKDIALNMVRAVALEKGIELEELENYDYRQFKEEQYDKLADEMRKALDMEYIYGILGESSI